MSADWFYFRPQEPTVYPTRARGLDTAVPTEYMHPHYEVGYYIRRRRIYSTLRVIDSTSGPPNYKAICSACGGKFSLVLTLMNRR